jgi:hypothetical protein
MVNHKTIKIRKNKTKKTIEQKERIIILKLKKVEHFV